MDNQFAGLVITASRQLEDSIHPQDHASLSPHHGSRQPGGVERSPSHRERAETLWDNQRVEHEWTQVNKHHGETRNSNCANNN